MLDEDQLRKAASSENPEGQKAPDREAIINKRRARQSGGDKKNKRALSSTVLIVGGILVFSIAIGPDGLMRMLGMSSVETQRTSQVDLSVERESGSQNKLDFVVPGTEEPKPVTTANPLDAKLKALEEQVAQMSKNRGGGMSAADMQKLLDRYSESIDRKFEQERQLLAEENERLRAEAAAAAETGKIDAKQRESEAVIVDDGGRTASVALDGTDPLSEEALDDLNTNERFLRSASSSTFKTSVSQKLTDPSRTVVQGTIISAVLETAIDTELPGSIRAQVMQPVYSFDGSRVLMPQGTLLIGQFNNNVDLAQKRVLIAWNRAVTPDGTSIELGSIGTDTLGRSGTLGNVDNRYATKFGASLLVSVISAAPALLAEQVSNRSNENSGTTINIGGSGGSGDRGGGAGALEDIGETASEQGKGVLEQYLSLPPVIRIPQGEEIRIFANRDLVFL